MKHTKHTIQLQDEDMVELVLPDGRSINIMLSNTDDEALPELDIGLPCEMAANCYTEHLAPAPALGTDGKTEHVRLVRQIIIPVETR